MLVISPPGDLTVHTRGMNENSPALQRWNRDCILLRSPGGTVDRGSAVPAGLVAARSQPGIELLGYCQTSLRDEKPARFLLCNILGSNRCDACRYDGATAVSKQQAGNFLYAG